MQLSQKTIEVIDVCLLISHVIISLYFFILIIPTNLLFPGLFWEFNLIFALGVAASNIPFGLRCPLTIWHNKVRARLDKNYQPTHSSIADSFVWLGITQNKISLFWVNTLVGIYLIGMTASFFISRF